MTTFDPLLPYAHEAPPSPGLYLHLFHGRSNPDDKLEAWGTVGPHIGPLHCVRTTYADTVFIQTSDGVEVLGELHRDLFPFNGTYYGDWTVYVHGQ